MVRTATAKLAFGFAALMVTAVVTITLFIANGDSVAADGPKETKAPERSVKDGTVHTFPNGDLVTGGSTRLVRTENAVTSAFNTNSLVPGNTYTMWWVVFNNPEYCQHPMPGLSACGEGDLLLFGGNPYISSSVLFAAGNIVGESGQASFGATLDVDQLPSGHGQHIWGPGLTDSEKAEVHLVIRDHGPEQPGLEESQVTSFGGGCTSVSDPSGTGPEGPYACADVQFTTHMPAWILDDTGESNDEENDD